jgi:hypothetical protein
MLEITKILDVPFWWLVFSSLSLLLSLAVIIINNIRKNISWYIYVPFSIIFLILSVLIFSLGPTTQTIAWIIFNGGFYSLSYITKEYYQNNFPSLIDSISRMLFAASFTAAEMLNLTNNLKQKLLIGSLSAFITLSITDIILYKSGGIEGILFSLMSNFFGGLILGVILGYIYLILNNIFSVDLELKYEISTFVKFISYSVTGTFVILILFYFIYMRLLQNTSQNVLKIGPVYTGQLV